VVEPLSRGLGCLDGQGLDRVAAEVRAVRTVRGRPLADAVAGADDKESDRIAFAVDGRQDIVGETEPVLLRLAREQNALRVKGYIAVKGKPMRLLVQAVGDRLRTQFDRPWGDMPRRSQLVVIGEHDHVDAAAIRAVLEG
jgi:cobalamin biosynthesis protein CobW